MLKLLKYEMIQSYRQYLLTLGIFLILCVLAPWLPEFIRNILNSLIIFACLGISIAVIVNIITNFNRSMYKRPGYLTLTLPVSTEKLVGAKFIGSLIWLFVSSIVLFAGIIILVLLVGQVPFDYILEIIKQAGSIMSENLGYIFINILNSITGVAVMILSFYAIVTLTKTRYLPKYKTVLGIAVYIGLLILGSSIMTWQPIDSFVSSLNTTAAIWFRIVLNLILSTGFYLFTVYLIDHKIEVE